jgi:diguanylate cyclase (GGDEF)-like protein
MSNPPNQQPLFGRESLFRQKLNTLRNSSSRTHNLIQDAESRRKQLESSTYLQQLQENISKRDPTELERVTMLDTQTELFNQSTFLRILTEEIKRAKRYKNNLSILLITVDELQTIVAENGDIAFDAVVAGVANFLMKTIRDVDIPARYDRETFCIVCPQTDAEGATTLADRLRSRIAVDRIAEGARNWTITISLGIASYPTNGLNESALIQSCLNALIEAQGTGNNYQIAQPVDQ